MVATERRAWGYVDPGNGLLALQAIASVLAGCAYGLRRRIRKLFKHKSENKAAVNTVVSPESD
jgi:hypothetical protein